MKDINASLVATMRPRQWVKNLFIFAAPFFSLKLFDPANSFSLIVGLASWCLITAATYLFNDIVDRKEDRLHPHKKHRPIASGALDIRLAYMMWFIFSASAIGMAFDRGNYFGLVVLAYFLLNIAYSLYLKHVIILDVMAIASGFVLRVISGAVLINVGFSEWIIMCTFMLSLLLGFSKRQEEITYLGAEASYHRRVLKDYDQGFLQRIPYVLVASTIVCYMLYTVSAEAIKKFGTKALIYTTPFVIYGLFRYVYIAYEKNKGSDPTQVLFQDLPTVLNIILWVIAVGLIIYVR